MWAGCPATASRRENSTSRARDCSTGSADTSATWKARPRPRRRRRPRTRRTETAFSFFHGLLDRWRSRLFQIAQLAQPLLARVGVLGRRRCYLAGRDRPPFGGRVLDPRNLDELLDLEPVRVAEQLHRNRPYLVAEDVPVVGRNHRE